MGIVIAILMFEVMIVIHEWGHFIVARKNGVFVQEFALGMGPAIVSYTSKKSGTMYSWRLFPIGGYCQMLGEEEESPEEGSFSTKSVWARLAIVAAGPLMNILTAFVLSVVVLAMSGYMTNEVKGLDPEGNAITAGMELGDVIVKIDGKNIHTYQDLTYAMYEVDGSAIEIVVKKEDGSKETLVLEPKYSEAEQRYLMGITIGKDDMGWADIVKNKGWGALPGAILGTLGQGFWELKGNVELVIRSVVQLVTGQVGMDNMMGPIGIVSTVGESYEAAAQANIKSIVVTMFSWVSLLSVNLGVMNLFPIPALDGSRIVFLTLEGIRRKPISHKIESAIYAVGFILLMILMVVVAYQDIVRLFA